MNGRTSLLRRVMDVWPQVRMMLVIVGAFSIAYAFLTAWDTTPKVYLHEAISRVFGAEFSLRGRSSREQLSQFDQSVRKQDNKSDGLMTLGPDVYLPAGSYTLHFALTPLEIDEKEPYGTIDVYRLSPEGEALWLVKHRVVDFRNFYKNPNVEFSTPGGGGHEFVLYVSSAQTHIALDRIDLVLLEKHEASYLQWFIVALACLGVLTFSVWWLLGQQFRWRPNTLLVMVVALLGYGVVAYQGIDPVIDIAMTGDSPNYLVLADYIARNDTLHIESIDEVYDAGKYVDLTGFEIFDPPNHMHEARGRIFPHHQFGYSVILAAILEIHRSAEAVVALSIIAVAAGLLFIYLALSTRMTHFQSALITLIAGASAPLLFFSHAGFML